MSTEEIERIVAEMSTHGASFKPEELLDLGVPGLQALLDEVFPQAGQGEAWTTQRMVLLIEQLGDDSFSRREAATAALQNPGRAYAHLVRSATEHADAEVRYRARGIVQVWNTQDAGFFGDGSQVFKALRVYVAQLSDTPSQQELARHVVRGLAARFDKTPRKEALAICLMALAKSHDDSVHNILLPLLKHNAPAVPMFAMKQISGRTGNSYVAPIHMGALHSGRPELVKCALRSMPCPIWDRRSRPAVREAYEKIFDGASAAWDFEDDPEFMGLSAFVAARDFGIEKAKSYLLARIGSPNRETALRAIRSLGDSYYRRRHIYPELLEALAPHLCSPDPDVRCAAVRTLGIYKGDHVLQHLVAELDDESEKVWQEAGRRLVDQHGYYRPERSPVPRMLRERIDRVEAKSVRQRIGYILDFLEKAENSSFRW